MDSSNQLLSDFNLSLTNTNSNITHLSFTVNKKLHTIKPNNNNLKHSLPKTTLLEYLREQGLKGTKLGCGTGACGACTVVVNNKAVNSCITPICSLASKDITTIEGLGDDSMPHKIQEILAKNHATQCGFCTPGVVMSLYNESQKEGGTSEASMEAAITGNLCRCTGYRPILDAVVEVQRAPAVADEQRDLFVLEHEVARGREHGRASLVPRVIRRLLGLDS